MRQNATIVLLSVIATLLFVLVAQNFMTGTPPMYAQTGGGVGASVGPIGVATGVIQGADAAGFWIFDPAAQRIAIYDYQRNQLRLRAVRETTHDMKAVDFNPTNTNRSITVKEMRELVSKGGAE